MGATAMILILFDDELNIINKLKAHIGNYSRYIIDLNDFENAKFEPVVCGDILHYNENEERDY